MSNYPPGVTGNEYAIAGPAIELGTTEMVTHDCDEEQYGEPYEGEATGELIGSAFELIFYYTCPRCGVEADREMDIEDYGPDPDEGRGDW